MKIYTGNFANITKYIAAGLTPISIAISARHFTGIRYRKLNPELHYLTDDPIDYEPKYNKKLLSLDANVVFNELKSLSKGKDIVFLCISGRMKEKEQQIQK